jgi:hypothetical protein
MSGRQLIHATGDSRLSGVAVKVVRNGAQAYPERTLAPPPFKFLTTENDFRLIAISHLAPT